MSDREFADALRAVKSDPSNTIAVSRLGSIAARLSKFDVDSCPPCVDRQCPPPVVCPPQRSCPPCVPITRFVEGPAVEVPGPVQYIYLESPNALGNANNCAEFGARSILVPMSIGFILGLTVGLSFR